MKPKVIISVSLLFFSNLFLAQSAYDGVKNHKIYLSTYVSALFTNDVSLAVEHKYKKFGQEFGLLYKFLLSASGISLWPEYLIDQGYGLNYHLKYALYSTEKMKISADLGYIYREGSYKNKKEVAFYYAEWDYRSSDLYRMDRRNTFSGLSAGLSGLFKLYKHFCAGFNLYLNYGKAYQSITIKEYLGSPKAYGIPPARPVITPYRIETDRLQYGATFLLKLSFQIY